MNSDEYAERGTQLTASCIYSSYSRVTFHSPQDIIISSSRTGGNLACRLYSAVVKDFGVLASYPVSASGYSRLSESLIKNQRYTDLQSSYRRKPSNPEDYFLYARVANVGVSFSALYRRIDANEFPFEELMSTHCKQTTVPLGAKDPRLANVVTIW